jgi:S1-C subfamily serine protease
MEVFKAMKRIGWMMAVAVLSSGLALGVSARAQSGQVKASPSAPDGNEASQVQASGGSYLGVFLADVSEARGNELKLAETRGAVVGKVREGSPAEKAGLREKDVILSFNGQPVESKAALNRLLNETPPGRSIALGVSRNGALQTIQVTLGVRSESFSSWGPVNIPTDADLMRQLSDNLRQQAEEVRPLDDKKARQLLAESESFRKQSEAMQREVERLRPEGQAKGFDSGRPLTPDTKRYYLGLSATPLSAQLAKFFDVKGGAGLLVTEVEPKSAAERAGLKAGDCLTAVNGERLNSFSDLTRLVSRPGKDEPEAAESSLTVVRDRHEQTIKVKPERR